MLAQILKIQFVKETDLINTFNNVYPFILQQIFTLKLCKHFIEINACRKYTHINWQIDKFLQNEHNHVTIADQESTMRHRITHTRMAIMKKKKKENNKCYRGYKENGTLINCWWKYKMVQPFTGDDSLAFPQKIKH